MYNVFRGNTSSDLLSALNEHSGDGHGLAGNSDFFRCMAETQSLNSRTGGILVENLVYERHLADTISRVLKGDGP